MGLYVIGFPIGASLMFAANMGIVGKIRLLSMSLVLLVLIPEFIKTLFFSHTTGLWTGLTIYVSLQALAYIVCLCKLDWKKAAEEVSGRGFLCVFEHT